MFELHIDAVIPLDKEERLKNKKRKPSQSEDNNEDNSIMDTYEKDTHNNVISKISMFRKILEPLGDMVDDVELRLSSSGINVQVMDSMRVAMANIFIPSTLFDNYRCDRNMILGIKIKEFLKILKINDNTSNSLHMHCIDEPTEITICFNSTTHSLTYTLKLFQFDIENYNFPAQKFEIEVQMDGSEFLKAPKYIGNYAEFLQIEVNKDKVEFKQKGDIIQANLELKSQSTGNDKVKIKVNNNVIDMNNEQGDGETENNDNNEMADYNNINIIKEIPIKYVGYFVKAVQQFDTLNICMGRPNPVYFELTMKDDGYFRYFVAPKVED
ncbi:Proliferating cell nuclear antigen protein [Spraguea lophii 42_110]|uniref:DNA sliding clamp PCNA n=1 Tax=Spraguea lophii (strain 42_110) TaxID=1358809 RepID=S7XRB2_SPRLO|nr:Proliferating cell nuclear antigen protein [Spraguea lophii 42_110]